MTVLYQPTTGAPALPPRVGLLPSLGGGTFLPVPPATPSGQEPGGSPPTDQRWPAGVAWQPEACGVSGAYDASSCPPDNDIEPPFGPGVIETNGFVVWAGDVCSPWDLTRPWFPRADRQLLATISYQVAFEFWTGTLARAANPDWPNRYLASPLSDVLTNGPTSVMTALQCLEIGVAKAAKGRRGMIHATPDLVVAWDAGGGLRREGGVILTINDTVVVPDAGYDGSGPNGQPAADGSVWAYGTEMIGVLLSPLRHVPDVQGVAAENFDRSVNTVIARAERDALVQWDGCVHVAVEVNLPLCGIGGS